MIKDSLMRLAVMAESISPLISDRLERLAQAEPVDPVADQQDFDRVFEIWDDRLYLLEELMVKLTKIAAKLKVEPPTMEIVGREVKMRPSPHEWDVDEQGHRRQIPHVFMQVRVHGEIPKMPGGWRLLGVVDHVSAEGNVVRAAPGEQVPEEFWTAEQRCDFCGARRQRVANFIVQNEAGEIKCVGSNCVQKALGWYKDPLALAQYLQYLSDHTLRAIGGEGDPDDDYDDALRQRQGAGIPMMEFLDNVAAIIRVHGFVPKSRADYDNPSTSERALNNIQNARNGRTDEREHGYVRPTPEDGETATNAYDWLQTLDRQWVGGSDYRNNILALRSVDLPQAKHFGIIASMVPLYLKERVARAEQQERERLQAEPVQQPEGEQFPPYIGNQGDKGVPFVLLVEKVIPWEGNFGTSFIHKMKDVHGRVVTWFGSRPLEEGRFYSMRATIKEHKEYTNRRTNEVTPETVIERPSKVEEVDSFEVAPPEAGKQPRQKSEQSLLGDAIIKAFGKDQMSTNDKLELRARLKQMTPDQAVMPLFEKRLVPMMRSLEQGGDTLALSKMQSLERIDREFRAAMAQIGVNVAEDASRQILGPDLWNSMKAAAAAWAMTYQGHGAAPSNDVILPLMQTFKTQLDGGQSLADVLTQYYVTNLRFTAASFWDLDNRESLFPTFEKIGKDWQRRIQALGVNVPDPMQLLEQFETDPPKLPQAEEQIPQDAVEDGDSEV